MSPLTNVSRCTLCAPVLIVVAIGAGATMAVDGAERSDGLRPFAAVHGQVVTQGVIGGRFELVDTLHAFVTSTVDLDPITGLYEYAYSIANAANSGAVIESFELSPIDPRPAGVLCPEHWEAWPAGLGADKKLRWVTANLGPPPPGWQDDSVSVYASAYSVEPGDTLSGFGFSSPLPPGVVSFKLDIWEELRPAEGEGVPECPFRGAIGQIPGPTQRRSED